MAERNTLLALAALTRVGGPSLVALFVLDALSRAILVTVVAFEALAVLGGDAQKVSVLYAAISAAGLAASFGLPWLIRRLGRSSALGLACLTLMAAAGLLASHSLAGLAMGLTLAFLGSSATAICLNLCILDYIPRHELSRFEPLRTVFSATAWAIGPVLGVYLDNRVAEWLPFALSAGFALALLIYFRALGITEKPSRNPAATLNPLRFARRYAAQPRLVLAWLLVTGRECWWVTFFIYTPILAVSQGLSEETGGLIVSAGIGTLLLITFWGWLGRRLGVRRMFMAGYLVCGALTMAVAAAGLPWLTAVLLVAAALAIGAVEGAGNVPFLRAVRARERAEMLTVYSSYRGVSSLATPAAFAVILQVFALPSVFIAAGAIMLSLSALSRYIPRRLGQDARHPSRMPLAGPRRR
ncbi:MAG: MFS transporter [Alphaproteobacteria bacterium]